MKLATRQLQILLAAADLQQVSGCPLVSIVVRTSPLFGSLIPTLVSLSDFQPILVSAGSSLVARLLPQGVQLLLRSQVAL